MTETGQIKDILTDKGSAVWSISPDATVYEAIKLMADKNVGALLVTNGGKLLGIISERDYTRKVALLGRSSKETPVREIVSSRVLCVSPDHTVQECLKLMTENRVRHLPVMRGDHILGIVSIGDLVSWTLTAQQATIQQLETYITGYPTTSP